MPFEKQVGNEMRNRWHRPRRRLEPWRLPVAVTCGCSETPKGKSLAGCQQDSSGVRSARAGSQ